MVCTYHRIRGQMRYTFCIYVVVKLYFLMNCIAFSWFNGQRAFEIYHNSKNWIYSKSLAGKLFSSVYSKKGFTWNRNHSYADIIRTFSSGLWHWEEKSADAQVLTQNYMMNRFLKRISLYMYNVYIKNWYVICFSDFELPKFES